MTFSTDFTPPKNKKRNWILFGLILSLGLNVFGLMWYVSRGVMDSNLPIATAIKSLKGEEGQKELSEVQFIHRITQEISPEGAKIVFAEYARRKGRLDALIVQVEEIQGRLKTEMSQPDLNGERWAADLKVLSSLMGQRLDLMTELVGIVLPKLSSDDRRKLVAAQEK